MSELEITQWDKLDREQLVELLKEHCFWVHLNANDTFAYSCADATEVSVEDLGKLLEIYSKYGADGIDAFQAKLRGVDVLPQRQTAKYKAALADLRDWVPFEEQEF